MTRAIEPERWFVDGNYSVVQDVVWDRADTVVWFDLPYVRVMARTVRRTLRRTVTREELWNGNKEPLSNLWSLNPERSIIVWAATLPPHLPSALHRGRARPPLGAAAIRAPRLTGRGRRLPGRSGFVAGLKE